jgi:hypothetical protein
MNQYKARQMHACGPEVACRRSITKCSQAQQSTTHGELLDSVQLVMHAGPLGAVQSVLLPLLRVTAI